MDEAEANERCARTTRPAPVAAGPAAAFPASKLAARVSDRFAHELIDVPLKVGGGRPLPDRRRWIVRPDDLLVLGFDLLNLRVEASSGDGPATLVRSGPGVGRLVVWFPPQHIIEEAYFATAGDYPVAIPKADPAQAQPPKDPDAASNDKPPTKPETDDEPPDPPPILAIAAGWSRLVFRVRDDQLPIVWTLEGVLAALRDLELSVPTNALPPAEPSSIFADLIGSAIEVATFGPLGLAAPLTAPRATARGPAAPRAAAPRAPAPTPLAPADAPRPLPIASSATALLLSAARQRRHIRTVGHALGVSSETGGATLGRIADKADSIDVLTPILLRPSPAPPTATQTALELPYRILLSPNATAAWSHAAQPVTSEVTGRTELWHTRLGVRAEDGTVVDGPDPMRTLRAVWTTDWPRPKTPRAGDPVDVPDHHNHPWRMSLDTFDRHNVVHLSSNFLLRDARRPRSFYEPRPLDVDLLALSSLGAWLDARGAWDFPQPLGLSVEEWRHQATLGRDHYVRVVYSGFLFPFGHRASVVKITERQFHRDRAGNPAYLRQRMFLVVREPVRRYRSSGLIYDGSETARRGQRYDHLMPFEAVRILTRVSPLLDPPKDDIDGKGQSAFWPNVGGQPFRFHLTATDTDGHAVDMAAPLIFVGKEQTDAAYEQSIIPVKVREAYEQALWPGTFTKRSTVDVQGQRVAYAESAAPDDTTFPTRTLTFGAEVPTKGRYTSLSRIRPRFFPVLRGAAIDVPSLQRLAGTADPARVVLADAYLRSGFADANAGQVFLAADPAVAPLPVRFSSRSDRSGGLLSPDIALSGLSRVTGPVAGDLAVAAAGTFNPDSWFKSITGARLFGVLSLAEVIDVAGFDERDLLPRIVGESLNLVEDAVGALERVRQLVATDPVAQTGGLAGALDQLLAPGTGSLAALLAGGEVAPVEADLTALAAQLAALPAALPGSGLPPGPIALLTTAGARAAQAVEGLLGDIGLLQRFADGDILPEASSARLEWRPRLKGSGPFQPSGERNLLLAVEVADAQGDGESSFSVVCALDDFVLDLAVLVLRFERIQLTAVAGRKMDVDVVFTGITFTGPLEFVETLRELIPLDGFSDPPAVEVTPAGITAGFSVGLPNLSIGVFSLENLSLGAGFQIPFVGPPLSTWFAFATRENPARLTVSMFGGGFYLGLTMGAGGLQVLEGAIEFGAACSVDFGVASGSVSAMAGLYFKIEGSDVTLAGYFRLRGEVEVLGIVSVCIELYLEMRFEPASVKCVGTATLSIEIDVALFSATVEISCTRKFAGSGPDPTLAELLDVQPDATSEHWDAYCAAFA